MGQPLSEKITKLGLVTHDYNKRNKEGLWDYTEHFARINHFCDREGCDTILYSLYTWDERSSLVRSQDSFFKDLLSVHRIILEFGNLDLGYEQGTSHLKVEIWQDGQLTPTETTQKFSTSQDSWNKKKAFVADLPNRRLANALVMICGESNIASLVRKSKDFNDPFEFNKMLADLGASLILNPVHDYMRRFEMAEKRRYYSQGGRTVVSVWNQGKGKESSFPWTVFHDGVKRTELVKELENPFSDQPDIRIGVLCLESVNQVT